jgi:hypothetical protein
MAGKDPALVGLGSYFVNVLDHCNTCHSAGPATEFAKGGNPYFKINGGAVVNQATYLGGGRVFPLQAPGAPVIVSRNLTPDKTGSPEGGRTFEEFRFIMQTGTDLDRLHLNCSEPGANPNNCYPDNLPFNGDLLQIMPWPGLRHLKGVTCGPSTNICGPFLASRGRLLLARCTTTAPEVGLHLKLLRVTRVSSGWLRPATATRLGGLLVPERRRPAPSDSKWPADARCNAFARAGVALCRRPPALPSVSRGH